jgi:hypothetical protein
MELHSETFNPADFAWRGLTLTPAAAAHIHELVAKKPEILGVRLGLSRPAARVLATCWIPSPNPKRRPGL